MKKTLTIILALTIALTCVSAASAEKGKEYYSTRIRRLGMTSSQMTNTAENRTTIAAVVLLEVVKKARDGSSIYNKLRGGGVCYVARYGSHIDIYYPTKDGKYLNLFMTPSSGKIKDYGIGSFSGSGSYTYVKVNMVDMWFDYRALAARLY